MKTVLVVLLAASVLAGCMSESADPPQTDVSTSSSDSTSSSRSSSTQTTSSGTTSTTTSTTTVTENGNTSTVSMTTITIGWDGKIGRWACLPSGPMSCHSPPVDLGDSNAFYPIDGTVTHLSATMTWTASTPLTEELYIAAFVMRSCGESCFESVEGDSAFVAGPSPLVLDLDLELEEGEFVGLHVGTSDPACHAAVVLLACASLAEQEFRVDGLATAMFVSQA